jgi:high-affinity Fe2+/Pb2+ permease
VRELTNILRLQERRCEDFRIFLREAQTSRKEYLEGSLSDSAMQILTQLKLKALHHYLRS